MRTRKPTAEPAEAAGANRLQGGAQPRTGGRKTAPAAGGAEMPDVIAIELKAAREARGLSMMALHRQTGIARTALHDYEAGRYKPGANEIRRLCAALGITPNRLLMGRDDVEAEPSPLEKLFEQGDTITQVVTLSVLLEMVTAEERGAFYRLLYGLVTARHSVDEVTKRLELAGWLTGQMGGRMAAHDAAGADSGEAYAQQLLEQAGQQLAEVAAGAQPPSSQAGEPRKAKKPKR